VDVAGTASVFATTAAAFRADRRYRMLGCGKSAVPGLWHPYAYINGGGMNLEWFRREVANRGAAGGKGPTLDALSELAARIEPRDDLPIFVPHLGGRVCPSQPELRGAWVGLTWDHTLGHLYRAVLEGVALEYAVYKQALLELYGHLPLRELRITGGGEKSPLWNQIKADAMRVPVRRIARSEGAPLGAALVAGYGVGVFRNLPAAASRWITLGEKMPPRRSLAAYYERRADRYQALLKCLDQPPQR
jgi:xylulokinase